MDVIGVCRTLRSCESSDYPTRGTWAVTLIYQIRKLRQVPGQVFSASKFGVRFFLVDFAGRFVLLTFRVFVNKSGGFGIFPAI